jgi:hypothetical protein
VNLAASGKRLSGLIDQALKAAHEVKL